MTRARSTVLPGIWACLGLFLFSRLPAIRCPFQLNVDEGQMLAQAMRFAQHPTPWVSVDGDSGGPVLSWLLLLAHGFGMPFSFQTAHLVAAVCLIGVLLAAFAAARELAGGAGAMLGLAAGAWWLALAPDESFVHYSSELVPALLIACALAAWARARARPGGAGLFIAGLLLGVVPWAKLQAVPIALVLGLWALAETASSRAGAPGRRAFWLVLGALLPSAVMLAWILAAGAWPDFWNCYIVTNWSRAGHKSWAVHAMDLRRLLFLQEGSSWFVDALLLALACLAVRGRSAFRGVARSTWALIGVLLAAGLFAALSPVTQYTHYEQLCLLPLVLLAAACGRILWSPGEGAGPKARLRGVIAFAVALVPAAVGYFLAYGGPAELEGTWNFERTPAFQTQVFVVDTVRQFSIGARSIAVWGWAPYVYVDLGLAPTTREAGYASMTDGNPSQAFIRAAFLADLEQSEPDAIVDVEDDIFGGVRRTAPASFPGLASLLARDYRLVGRGTATRGGNRSLLVDVYLRRVSAPGPSATQRERGPGSGARLRAAASMQTCSVRATATRWWGGSSRTSSNRTS